MEAGRPPLAACGDLGKSLHLSEPQLPPGKMGSILPTSFSSGGSVSDVWWWVVGAVNGACCGFWEAWLG